MCIRDRFFCTDGEKILSVIETIHLSRISSLLSFRMWFSWSIKGAALPIKRSDQIFSENDSAAHGIFTHQKDTSLGPTVICKVIWSDLLKLFSPYNFTVNRNWDLELTRRSLPIKRSDQILSENNSAAHGNWLDDLYPSRGDKSRTNHNKQGDLIRSTQTFFSIQFYC